MSERRAKYTRGPWRLCETLSHYRIQYQRDDGTYKDITVLPKIDWTGNDTKPFATLIAAAPELFEIARKTLMRGCQQCKEVFGTDLYLTDKCKQCNGHELRRFVERLESEVCEDE